MESDTSVKGCKCYGRVRSRLQVRVRFRLLRHGLYGMGYMVWAILYGFQVLGLLIN